MIHGTQVLNLQRINIILNIIMCTQWLEIQCEKKILVCDLNSFGKNTNKWEFPGNEIKAILPMLIWISE